MSAFFRAASDCIGPRLFRAPPQPKSAVGRMTSSFCRAACSDSGSERRAFPISYRAEPARVSLRRAFPRRRPGSRAARLCMASASGAGNIPQCPNEPAGFSLLSRGGSTPHFPAASPPEYRTFRGKQKMAANKKINNFSSKAPLFQLPTPQGGPPLRCFT